MEVGRGSASCHSVAGNPQTRQEKNQYGFAWGIEFQTVITIAAATGEGLMQNMLRSPLKADKSTVLYFDTEQSKYHVQKAVKGICSQINNPLPNNLQTFGLRKENPQQRFKLVEYAIENTPNLGFVVIDEQHRFGVEQRAKLWRKNNPPPHILVMTATPIPRTLAMTVYGDLDVSVIDELPPGRKTIKTEHCFDSARLRIFGFITKQIDLGRQVYLVYPLIQESDTFV